MSSTIRQVAGPAMLFCPADRPERYVKALERADSVIFDLEDAVAPEQKSAARQSLRAWCQDERNRSHLESDPARVVVRINAASTEDFDADVEALSGTGVRVLMLSKAESAQQIDQITEVLPGASVLALCETPLGVIRSEQIAEHPAVSGLMWGSEDLIAAIGGSSSRTEQGQYRQVAQHSRAAVLLSATAFGKQAIDSIYADFSDAEGLAAEARDASASGFVLKANIHPSQVAVVRRAYAPSDDEVEYAQALLAEVNRSAGAVQFRGAMVDEPLIRHAENIMERAEKQKAGAPPE